MPGRRLKRKRRRPRRRFRRHDRRRAVRAAGRSRAAGRAVLAVIRRTPERIALGRGERPPTQGSRNHSRFGASIFVLLGSADASSVGAITSPGYAQTSVIGNTAYTTWSPGSTSTYVKSGQDAFMGI